MSSFNVQTNRRQYFARSYNHRARWGNFWHQYDEVQRLDPKNVLEIGVGSGLVRDFLDKCGIAVTTVDIDADLYPDYVASVEKLPCEDESFDAVLAAEILEHLPWDKAKGALKEIYRVSKKYAVITLPHAGTAVIARVRLPKLGDRQLFIKIPFFWKRHVFKGQHFWELGKKGYSRKKFRSALRDSGFKIIKEKIFSDDYVRIFYILKK